MFPKTARLRTKREFSRVIRQGKRLVGKFLCIDYAAGKSRLGISAPGKYGNAPQRNRFKRLVREAFRQGCFGGVDLHVLPRQEAKRAGFKEIFEEIKKLLG